MIGILLKNSSQNLTYLTDNEGCGYSDRAMDFNIYCANEGCGSLATMHKISNLLHRHKISTGSTIRLRFSVPLCQKCYDVVNKS